MADQQFCLRWNHHHTTLINVFESLLKDESLVDVTLYAEGRPVRAHKVVLSACSQYFRAIFSAHQENHPVIILKDVPFSELRALVDYMYIGEVNVCQDQLASLIKTAESLKIKGLADGSNRKPPSSPPPALPLQLPM
ncbi:longitudinals lacking protein, isoforms H/M/V-like, partial [Pollicipes pollicipes]